MPSVPSLPAGWIADVVDWFGPALRLLLALAVAYMILQAASSAADWLSDTRAIQWAVYLCLGAVIASALLGALDAIAVEATGQRLTGWGVEAAVDALWRYL